MVNPEGDAHRTGAQHGRVASRALWHGRSDVSKGSISIASQGVRGENWFVSLEQAQRTIEAWRCEYNEERPKKARGGMTPAE